MKRPQFFALLILNCLWPFTLLGWQRQDRDQSLDTWNLVHSFPPPFTGIDGKAGGDIKASLNDIAFGNGAYVVVGENGRIWRTTNIRRGPWLEQKSPATNALLAVTFGSGLFVAVGSSGKIIASPDGQQWALSSTNGATNDLNSVTIVPDGFASVGNDGTVMLSSDAHHWEHLVVPGASLKDILYAGGQYLAVGKIANGAGAIFQSSDGRSWKSVYQIASKSLRKIAFGSNRFVAIGPGGVVASSSDGTNWQSQILPKPTPSSDFNAWPNDLVAVTFGARGFIASTTHWMFSSQDGLDWKLVREELPDPIAYAVPGVTPDGSINAIRYLENTYVAVGISHPLHEPPPGAHWQPLVLISKDASQWRMVSQSLGLNAVAYGNGTFVAVGEQGAILSSQFGNIWVEEEDPNLSLNDVQFADGQFVAVGNRGVILTSQDGHIWVERRRHSTTDLLIPLQQETYGNGLWIAVGAYQANFLESRRIELSSTDAKNWTVLDLGQFSPSSLSHIAYGSGYFVVLSWDNPTGHSYMQTSNDETHWTLSEKDGRVMEVLAYGNGVFTAIMNDNQIWTTSSDRLSQPIGAVWTKQLTLPVAEIGGLGMSASVSFNQGRFLALGAGTIWSSTNGTNWLEHTSLPSKEQLRDSAYGQGIYVVVGTQGTILESGPFELALADPHPTTNGFAITVRVPPNQTAAIESSDGLNQSNWTTLTTIEGGDAGKSEEIVDSSPELKQRYYRLK